MSRLWVVVTDSSNEAFSSWTEEIVCDFCNKFTLKRGPQGQRINEMGGASFFRRKDLAGPPHHENIFDACDSCAQVVEDVLRSMVVRQPKTEELQVPACSTCNGRGYRTSGIGHLRQPEHCTNCRRPSRFSDDGPPETGYRLEDLEKLVAEHTLKSRR